MFAPIVEIVIPSIYPKANPGPLPKRMAKCTVDMKQALQAIATEVMGKGGKLILSDLFRTHDEQLQANKDYESGKKSAYSPPPGGSFHESGRAFDLDLGALGHLGATGDRLTAFHPLAESRGVTPITAPDCHLSESWHYERRASHQLVHDYYAQGNGTNFQKPAKAAAASAIVSVGIPVDALGPDPLTGYIQSGLIRLGQLIGNLDGSIGPKTINALNALNIQFGKLEDMAQALEFKLMERFPDEYFPKTVD